MKHFVDKLSRLRSHRISCLSSIKWTSCRMKETITVRKYRQHIFGDATRHFTAVRCASGDPKKFIRIQTVFFSPAHTIITSSLFVLSSRGSATLYRSRQPQTLCEERIVAAVFFFLVCAEWRITEKKCLLRTSHIVCRMSFGIQIELHTRSVSVLRLLATPNRIQISREPIRRRTVCNL